MFRKPNQKKEETLTVQAAGGDAKPVVPELPIRRGIHKAFILYSTVAGFISLWMALGQVMGCFVYDVSHISYVLRGYVVASCMLLILVELEWTNLARSPLLNNFIGRGLIYIFIGVIGMQENDTASTVREDWDGYQVVTDIVRTVAWNMTGCGVVYFVMGVFCLQFVLTSLREGYQMRLHPAKTQDDVDLEEGVEVEYDSDQNEEEDDIDDADVVVEEEASNVETADSDAEEARSTESDKETEELNEDDKSVESEESEKKSKKERSRQN